MTTTVTVAKTIGDCLGGCGYELVRRSADVVLEPHQRQHKGRRLCARCYDYRRQRGQLVDYPRESRRLVDVIHDYNELVVAGVRSRRALAERIGISIDALDRAIRRARDYDMYVERRRN